MMLNCFKFFTEADISFIMWEENVFLIIEEGGAASFGFF